MTGKFKQSGQQLSSPLQSSENKPKMSTFSDDENFAASVSLDYVPNPDADNYTISFDKKGNPSIKAVPRNLLPTDSTISVKNFKPTSMYIVESGSPQ